MWRRASLVVVVIACATGPAAAGTDVKIDSSDRDARRARKNLPDGWSWPPSRELKRDGRRCLSDLKRLGVKFERARRKKMIATPVVVADMRFGDLMLVPTYRKPPFVMDCRLARALALHAAELVELGIRELRFSSIHDFRRARVRNVADPPLSRHSFGLAIDVFEIVTSGGARLVVKQDYWSLDPTLLFIELALRATGGFRAVLSPAVDPVSHYDHFHLEVAVDEIEGAAARAAKKRKHKTKKNRKRKKRRKKR